MPYPEKLLADDEQVVEHLHPHWITIVPAAFWFVLFCAAAGVGIAYAPDHGTGRTVVLIIIAVVWVVLMFLLVVRPLITWRTTHYVFTTHRVLIRRGLLNHVGRDIALQRITDVGFAQSLWDRIVRAGTLTIESASEHGQETLTNIPNSSQQQQLLNRLIEQDGERRQRSIFGGQQQPYPPQGYPPPQQNYPPQNYPPQNYPTQNYPTQNYPPGGTPPPGYQPTRPEPPYPPER